MRKLTPEGETMIAEIASRHGVSTDAVRTLLEAVANGGGTMAQFNHPELGGGGQWLRGGMTMVGDMFNHSLKARVDAIASELSDRLAAGGFASPMGSVQSQSQGGTGAEQRRQLLCAGHRQRLRPLVASGPGHSGRDGRAEFGALRLLSGEGAAGHRP